MGADGRVLERWVFARVHHLTLGAWVVFGGVKTSLLRCKQGIDAIITWWDHVRLDTTIKEVLNPQYEGRIRVFIVAAQCSTVWTRRINKQRMPRRVKITPPLHYHPPSHYCCQYFGLPLICVTQSMWNKMHLLHVNQTTWVDGIILFCNLTSCLRQHDKLFAPMYSTCSVTTEYLLRFLSSSSCQNRFFWIDRHENSLRAKAKSHKEKCGKLCFLGIKWPVAAELCWWHT